MPYTARLTRTDISAINLRAETAALGELASILGIPLPSRVGDVSRFEALRVLCMGPDRWLLYSKDRALAELVENINQALDQFHCNATLVTDQFAAYGVTGEDAQQVLSQGCAIDLHPDTFGPDQCAATGFARSQILLDALNPPEAYHLFIESSLGGYLESWFARALGKQT